MLNLSVVMQRDGKWWIEALSLGIWRVAPLWAEGATSLFWLDRSDRLADRSDRWTLGWIHAGRSDRLYGPV